MAVSRPRHRGAGASRARRAEARGARPAPWFRARALLFASLALAAPSRASSEGTGDDVSSVSVSVSGDGLRDVPFETTPLPGFDALDASVTSVPTTIGGRVDWLGGVAVRFPGVVPETGQSWNDFGGWSTLVGDKRGERLWTLTDNYAYLLRVELDLDEQSSTLTNVRAIRNATDFAILVPADETRLASTRQATTTRGDEQFGDNDGAVKVARRVDVESIVSIPVVPVADREQRDDTSANASINPSDATSDATGDATGDATSEDGDYAQSGGLLADFAVGVEDSWELPANDVIRFRSGRRHAWTDVPGADDALNACDANLGPEALVWLPKAGTKPATLVTFCETPAKKQTHTANAIERRDDAVFGFAFPLRDDEDETETLASDDFPQKQKQKRDVFFFNLVNVDEDCGLSDATVTPDGVFVLLLYHCYSYPPGHEFEFGTGTHSTQIRVARTTELRGVLGGSEDAGDDDSASATASRPKSVKARLLARWSGKEGCPLTNMEGIHAVVSENGEDIDLVLVSDNNLQPDDPTQIVRMQLVGGADVPDEIADAFETDSAREARKIYTAALDGPNDVFDAPRAALGDAFSTRDERAKAPNANANAQKNSLWSFFPFSSFARDASGDEETYAEFMERRRNETVTRGGVFRAFPPDAETGIDFLEDAIENDAALIERLKAGSDEDAYDAIKRERGTILAQLRAMSLLTLAATLATSAVVAVAALAAASVARKASFAGGTTEELRPLGVAGGVAYPKPYGYSEEYEYDAV
jgi:hypothetical protein